MKKNVSLLNALLMASTITLGLASCGTGSTSVSSSSDTSANSATSANSEVTDSSVSSSSTTDVTPVETLKYDPTVPVSIKFYSTMGQKLRDIFDPFVEKFQNEHPNITVEHTSIGGYDEVRDQIKTELGAVGEGPNLAYCYPDHVALYNLSRKVQPLDKFIYNTEKNEDGTLKYGLTEKEINDFVPGYWNEGKSFGDNQMYSLPFSKSTEVLYYNKDEFTRLGLKVPTHWFKDDVDSTGALMDATTSMEYVCEQLSLAHPNDIPLGYDSEANWFITMCEQYGSPYTTTDKSNHFLFDNEVNRTFVTRFADWAMNKHYVTTQQIVGNYTSTLFVNTDSTKTTSYMSIGSSAGASNQKPVDGLFEVGIAPIPQVDQNNRKVISQGPSICMFRKDNEQEVVATWLFLKYLTTNVALQANFSSSSGYVPAITSVYSNNKYVEFLDDADGYSGITALSAKVCSEQSDAYFTSPAFVGSSEARTQVGNLMVAAFTGTSVADAFKDAIAQCEASL